MERKCSQTIRVDFPIDVFYGTEFTVTIPKITNMIKRIRLVTNTSIIVVEKIELVTNYEVIETLYGDYIKVENNFKTPCEKRSKLQELISNGYLEIPFETTKNGLFVYDDLFMRVLFKNIQSSRIDGYFFIDYYITHEPPKTPFIHKTTHISRFNTVVNSASRIKINMYVPGPVYEMYFTVRDENDNYIDVIKNITLYSPNERINLTGKYLRYAEPIKRNGIFPEDHMYMYSFGIDEISSGSTYFGEESYFIIDLYDNDKEYTLDVWAKSHDFLYIKENGMKRMFISNEMLLDLQTEKNTIQPVPVRISYINYSDTIQIFYQSNYNISNVSINDTNMSNFSILRNSILFTKINSKNSEYYANIVFSSDGFLDTMCYFNIIGNNLYLNKIKYNEDGKFPNFIDASQVFHYIYGNTFDSSNIFTSNISSFVIDENKNYIFSTFTNTTSNILGTSYAFSGPGSIVSKYDKNMNLLSYYTFSNSNVCLSSNGSYVSYSNGKSTNGIDAGNSTLIVDSIDDSYSSGRVMSSSSGINNSTFGLNTDRSFLFYSGNVISIVSNTLQTTTQVKTINGNPIWGFMFSSNSFISDNSLSFSSNGYCIKSSNSWNIKVSNVLSSSINMNIIKDPIINNIYVLAGYNNTKPILTGYDIKQGSGFFVIKIDSSGNIKYVLSFTGSIVNVYQAIDSVTGMYFVSVQTDISSLLNVYKNGNLTYSDTGKYQFFVIDNFGDVNNYKIDKNLLFKITRNDYSYPLQTSTYFNQPTPINYQNYYWVYAMSGPSDYTATINSILPSQNDVFFTSVTQSNSNVYDIFGDTKINFYPEITTLNGFIFKSGLKGNFKNFSRVTNVKNVPSYVTNRVDSKYMYTLFTTSNGLSNVYSANGTSTSILNSSYSDNLLLMKFDQNENSYSNWFMNIENSQGNTLSIDNAGNLYITGKKMSSSSSNVFINNTKVATLPSTTTTLSSFFIKLDQNDSFVNYAFVENTNNDATSWVCVDTNYNIYFGSKKNRESSNINGNSSTILPGNISQASIYIVKFDQNCNYNSWYAILDSYNSSGSVDLMSLKCTDSNIYFSYNLNIGGAGGNLYVNGTTVQTIPRSSPSYGGGSIKFSNDTLSWYNTIEGGVQTSVQTLDLDKYDNMYLTGIKQGGVMNIRINNTIVGTIPSTIADSGYVIRINSDGSYSNCLCYMDTNHYDGINIIKLDQNGDFYVAGNANGFPGPDKSLYIYDKYGYVTYKTTDTYSKAYSGMLKINSNFTLNKISI